VHPAIVVNRFASVDTRPAEREDVERMSWTAAIQVVVAVIAGAIIAIQPGINGMLSRRLDHPIQASVISFTVGLLFLVVTCLALGQRLPRPATLKDVPLWVCLGGGMVGAFFVTTSMIVAPKIGAGVWVALIVAGQMAASLALDHFGILGFRPRAIGWQGYLGALLLVAGAALVCLRRTG
jgi:transporter family-2 protein